MDATAEWKLVVGRHLLERLTTYWFHGSLEKSFELPPREACQAAEQESVLQLDFSAACL